MYVVSYPRPTEKQPREVSVISSWWHKWGTAALVTPVLTIYDWQWVNVFSCSVMSDSLQPPWAVAHQAPLSIGFPRQEYRSGLPLVEGIHLQTFIVSALCDMSWALRRRRWFLSLWTCSQPCTQIIEIKKWKSLFWEHQPEKANQFLRGKPRTEAVNLIA